MNVLPSSRGPAVAQRVRRRALLIGTWLRRHPALLSWLVWGAFVLLCVLWVQRYYRPPAGPPWIGKTVRVTVCALVGLLVREWLSLRWEEPGAPD